MTRNGIILRINYAQRAIISIFLLKRMQITEKKSVRDFRENLSTKIVKNLLAKCSRKIFVKGE